MSRMILKIVLLLATITILLWTDTKINPTAETFKKTITVKVVGDVAPLANCSLEPRIFNFDNQNPGAVVVSPVPLRLQCAANSRPLSIRFSLIEQSETGSATISYAVMDSNDLPPAPESSEWIPASNFNGHEIYYSASNKIDTSLYAKVTGGSTPLTTVFTSSWEIQVQDGANQFTVIPFSLEIRPTQE